MLDKDHIILWPLYFNKNKSRSKGRRVPIRLAISKPTVEDITKAVKKLGLNPIIEREKRHPSTWFEEKGRVLVKKSEVKIGKNKFLKEISKVLKEVVK